MPLSNKQSSEIKSVPDSNISAVKVLELINDLRPLLPIQNPMPFFVHNNPLMYWERYPFAAGIEKAILTYENTLEDKTRLHWRNIEDFVLPIIISYFDQGINLWTGPSDKKSLWGWYLKYIESSLSLKSQALPSLKKELPHLIKERKEILLAQILEKRFGDNHSDWKHYLQTLLFHLKGWSGMVNVLENNPHLFPIHSYQLSVLEWTLILATAENALVEKKNKKGVIWNLSQIRPREISIQNKLAEIQKKEFSYYRKTINEFKSHLAEIQTNQQLAVNRPQVMAFFCLDDREESLRRSLETLDPQYETFGTLGFYGIDMALKRPNHMIYQAQCPPVVNPRKKAREILEEEKSRSIRFFRNFIPHLNQGHFTSLEPFTAFFCWPIYFVALLFRTLSPVKYHAIRNHFHLDNYLDENSQIIFDEGYTLLEKAQIVKDIIGGAGLSRIEAKLVFIIGHASTTTNNPFQQSYGCGACSGQSGFSNAKVFCEFANDHQVRAELEKNGITIDPHTEFVAACHDTSLDKIVYAKRKNMAPSKHFELFCKFQKDIEDALALNEKERWAQFHLPSHRNASDRSFDWSEPRPEFGHSQVALSVFGPRWLTAGHDLRRRAFLVSYGPDCDPTGEHLAYDIISALPVCANINLDYFTSQAFPQAFGAGSKLPLNVVAGIGLMAGAKNDLKIGLANQMVDRHEALRLLVFIYCDSKKLEVVLEKSKRLQLIIKNNWMHVVRIEPVTFEFEYLTSELKHELQTDLNL